MSQSEHKAAKNCLYFLFTFTTSLSSDLPHHTETNLLVVFKPPPDVSSIEFTPLTRVAVQKLKISLCGGVGVSVHFHTKQLSKVPALFCAIDAIHMMGRT